MWDDNWVLIWLSVMLALVIGIVLGVVITKLSRKRDTHIRELEKQLSRNKKELEAYRDQVNEHFIRASELLDQMTSSYRAIFMHFANGAQELCGQNSDASHLLLSGNEFLAPSRLEDIVAGEDEPAEQTAESRDEAEIGETVMEQEDRTDPETKEGQSMYEEEAGERKAGVSKFHQITETKDTDQGDASLEAELKSQCDVKETEEGQN